MQIGIPNPFQQMADTDEMVYYNYSYYLIRAREGATEYNLELPVKKNEYYYLREKNQ